MNRINITLSIPYWLPSSGIVALWLMAGAATLVWCALTTLGNRRAGYSPCVVRDPPWLGLLCTALLVVIWPLPIYLTTKRRIRSRRESI